DTLDPEPGGRLDREGDALGGLHRNRVAEAQRELEVAPPGLHAVTDTDDLQGLAVALGHPGDHVGDQRAGQSVQGPALPLVVRALHVQYAVLTALDGDRLGDRVRQGALGALHA